MQFLLVVGTVILAVYYHAMGATATMTLAEFAALPDEPGKQELLKGELIRMPLPKGVHSLIQGTVVELLTPIVAERQLGRVLTDAGFELADDTCLGPDVAFVTNQQLSLLQPNGWFPGAPALAVEVLSPSNRASEIEDKIRCYLDAGGTVVWVINPPRRRLTKYYRDGAFETLEAASQGIVQEPLLFQGFHFPVSRLFDGLGHLLPPTR